MNCTPKRSTSTPRRRRSAITLRVAAAAVAAAGCLAVMVPGASTAVARCVGSSTAGLSYAHAAEYNLNNATCNGDLAYTGRYDDNSTMYGIVAKADLNQDGVYGAGDHQSALTSISGVPAQNLWSYTDSNSASYIKLCHYTSSTTQIGCSGQATNSGY